MFPRSQIAKNLTLASLNSRLYSPPNTTKSRLGSPGVQDLDDSFQSNSFHMSPGPTTGFSKASTGLGIIFPGTERTGYQEGLHGTHKLGFDHDMVYRHRLPTRSKAIFEPDVLEGTNLEPFTWPSLLDHVELPAEYLDLMSDEPVIERKQDFFVHTTLPALSVSLPTEKNGAAGLQKVLGASGYTVESLLAEPASSGDNERTTTEPESQPPDLQSNAAYLQKAFRHLPDSPVLGINPADIMSMHLQYKPDPPQDPPTPELKLEYPEDSEPETKSSIPSATTSPRVPQMDQKSPVPLTAQNLSILSELTSPRQKSSNYEPSLSSSSGDESIFVPSPKFRSRFTKATKRQAVKRRLSSPDVATMPQPSTEESNRCGLSDLSINYGTPVLDAHRGITLNELRAKAERYRLRNQCQEFDKKWLLSFAGKLTPQGLLSDNYRCYIVGCNQSNRRRDHIVIHVGGHLDQRPWVCHHCPARFLRKNECKRHELSHTGTRPFVCTICPSGASAFARQDLLKRHEKRTHNVDTTRGRAAKRHRLA